MRFLKLLLLVITILSLSVSQTTVRAQIVPTAQKATGHAGFIEEKGQFKTFDNLRFHWYGKNMFIYLLTDRVVFISREVSYVENDESRAAAAKGDDNLAKKLSAVTSANRFDLVFVNSNPDVAISGEGKETVQLDYYLAHCPDGIRNAPSFDKVRYSNLYPDIDLVFSFDGEMLKYEFDVRSGGDPSSVGLRWDGVKDLQINSNAEVQFNIGSFNFTDKSPVSFCGDRSIATNYILDGNTIKFNVADYDRTQTLVIDPSLYWSSSLQYNGYGSWGALVTNSTGQYYVVDWEWNPGGADVAAYLSSAGTNNLYSADAANFDIIISKFSKTGVLVWACRYGGTGDDDVNGGVALDDNDNLFIAGISSKEFSAPAGDLPLQTWTGALNMPWNGTCTGNRGYLLKFLANNTRQWATYLDNGTNLEVFDIACGLNNDIYLAGKSGGSLSCTGIAIPSGTGYQGNYTNINSSHNFILRFNNAGALTWSTWCPGTTNSTGRISDIAINKTNGDVFLAGDDLWSATYTFSAALISAAIVYMGSDDMFYMKFNTSNAAVPAYGKYFGGAGFDKINIGAANGDIELDASGNLYVCGHTYSANFPLVNPGGCTYYDGIINDGTGITANEAATQDGYLFKVNAAGAMSYSTFFGGTNYTSMKQLKADSHGNLWICGQQTTAGLAPVVHADYFNQALTGTTTNVMFAQLGPNDNMEWLSYYGFTGYSDYNGYDIWEPATDSTYLYMTGNFNNNPSNVTNAGGGYQFLSTACSGAVQFRNYLSTSAPFTISGATTLCAGASTGWTSTSAGGSWLSSNTAAATVNSSSGLVTGVAGGSSDISYTLTVLGCPYTVTETINITDASSIASVSGTSPLCVGATDTYTANSVVLGGGSGAWSSSNSSIATVNSSGLVTAVSAGNCNITYTITGGCGGPVSMQQSVTVNPATPATPGAISGTTPVCPGTSLTYSISAVTGSSTYSWTVPAGWIITGGDGTTTITVTTGSAGQNGSITVTAGNTCGTSAASNLNVTVTAVLSASVSVNAAPNPICAGTSVTFNATPANGGTPTYQWYVDGSPEGTNSSSYSSTSLTNNSEVYCVMTSSETCVTGSPATSNTITMTVDSLSVAPTAITATLNPLCIGDSTTLSLQGGTLGSGATWLWYTGSCGGIAAGTGTSIIVTPSVNTTYYALAQGTCNTTLCASITVTTTTTTNASITSSGPYCTGGSALSLTAVSPGGTWSGIGITNTATGLFDPTVAGEGSHTIIYLIPGSCGSSDTIALKVNPSPAATTTGVAETCIGAGNGSANAVATGGTAPYSYLWSGSQTTASLSGLAPGNYTVIITDANGCADADTAFVSAATIACETITPVIYLPNVFSPNGDENNDVLLVRGQGITSMNLKIYDRWGEKVFETSDMNDGWDGTFRGKKLDNGVYVYTLTAIFNTGDEYSDKGNITLLR